MNHPACTTIRNPRILNKRTDPIPGTAVYCGRPSIWGNPFIIGRDGSQDEVCDKYEAWIMAQPKLLAKLPTLAGRDLVCWCRPKRCHCETLLRLANPQLF